MAIYQVSVLQSLLLQEVRNVYYYEVPAPLLQAEQQELVDGVRAAYVSSGLGAQLANGWSTRGADVRQVDVPGLLTFQFLYTGGQLAGSNTADTYATQIALLVSGKGLTAPPNRVRSYLCGWSEADVSDLGLFFTTAQAFAENFIVAVDTLAAGGSAAVRQSVQWSLDNTFVVAANPLFSYTSTGVPATQRRRRIGRGI